MMERRVRSRQSDHGAAPWSASIRSRPREDAAEGESLSVELRRLGDEMAGVARTAGAKLPLHGSGAVLAVRKRDHPRGIEVAKVSERPRELRARLRVRQELDPPCPLLCDDEAPDERLLLGHHAPYKGRRENERTATTSRTTT